MIVRSWLKDSSQKNYVWVVFCLLLCSICMLFKALSLCLPGSKFQWFVYTHSYSIYHKVLRSPIRIIRIILWIPNTSVHSVLFVLNVVLLLLYLLAFELSYFRYIYILAWPMQCFLMRKLVVMFSVVSVLDTAFCFSVGLQLEHLSFPKFSDHLLL